MTVTSTATSTAPNGSDAIAKNDARGMALRWIGLTIILTVAAIRFFAHFNVLLVFDTDPKLDPTPLTGFGPGGSLFLDALLLIGCAIGLLGEARASRHLNWLWFVLAIIPIPIVIWHGSGSFDDLWIGMTWAAGLLSAVTLAHLCRTPVLRHVAIAVLAALVIPLLVRGGFQVTIEHNETIRAFESNKASFLASQGWEPGSPEAAIYERRLRQPQPLGWFITTNVYASTMAVGLMLWLGCAIVTWRTRHWIGLGATSLIALACAAGLVLTGSKGAGLAAVFGLIVIGGLSIVRPRLVQIPAWCGGALAIAAVMAVLLAVVARGTLLPETFAGERSLLFRWHYLQSSATMFAEHPTTGVGPAGYQSAYMLHRQPRNPEEVTSAHNVFADWLCALGIAGAAWGLLFVLMLRRAGLMLATALRHDDRAGTTIAETTGGDTTIGRAPLAAMFTIAVAGSIVALMAEMHVLSDLAVFSRIGGVAGLLLAGALLVRAGTFTHAAASLGVAVSAIVLAMHSQIEMTFHQPGSAVWAMLVLAVAARLPEARPAQRSTSLTRGLAVAAILLSLWISAWWAWPATQQQVMLIDIAGDLSTPAASPRDEAHQRLAAVDRLLAAGDLIATNGRIHELAVEQQIIASTMLAPDDALNALQHAAARAATGFAQHGGSGWLVLARAAHRELAHRTDGAAHWDAAIDAARILTTRDPHGISAWQQYGDMLWEAGQRDAARTAYAQALTNNRNFELDPLKQLSSAQRDTLAARVTPDDEGIPQEGDDE